MSNNKSTGIKVSGKNNLVENNYVEGSDVGYDISGEGNTGRKNIHIVKTPENNIQKQWYEKPIGIITLSIIAIIIGGYILHKLKING